MQTYEEEYLDWYTRINDTVGEPFDPTVLVQSARDQWSKQPDLAEAFARCTAIWHRHDSDLYSYFMAPPYRAARWHFYGSRMLQHPTLGRLVVDVIVDPAVPGVLSIGGIEYLDRVMRHVDYDTTPYWPLGYDPEPLPARPTLRVVHRGTGTPATAPQAEISGTRRMGGA